MFAHAAGLFEEGRDYTEKEVNEILRRIYTDYALLRRYLVDFKMLERNDDGTIYRKIRIKD